MKLPHCLVTMLRIEGCRKVYWQCHTWTDVLLKLAAIDFEIIISISQDLCLFGFYMFQGILYSSSRNRMLSQYMSAYLTATALPISTVFRC